MIPSLNLELYLYREMIIIKIKLLDAYKKSLPGETNIPRCEINAFKKGLNLKNSKSMLFKIWDWDEAPVGEKDPVT